MTDARSQAGHGLVVIRLSDQAYAADHSYAVASGVLMGFSETEHATETNQYTEVRLQRG